MKIVISFSMLLLLALSVGQAPAKITPAELNPLYIYVGSTDDGGWNKTLETGRLLTDEKFPGVVSNALQNLPEGPEFMIEVEKAIASRNSRLVIASSYGYGDFLSRMAARHPNIYFVHISGYNAAFNLAPAFAKIYQARYLTGIIAGLTTKNNCIGYVAAHPIAEVIRGINAFTLGLRTVNPQATVKVVWLNSWFDAGKEEDYACQLIEQGCDVLTIHTDTTAIAQVCERLGAAFVGYNSDMREFAPDQFLVAPIWHWDVLLSRYYLQVMNGTFDPQYYYPDLSSGVIGLTPYGPRVSEQAKLAVEQARAELLLEDNIFTGPIKDSQGVLRLQSGEKITLAQIRSMDWLVEGVEQVNLERRNANGPVCTTNK